MYVHSFEQSKMTIFDPKEYFYALIYIFLTTLHVRRNWPALSTQIWGRISSIVQRRDFGRTCKYGPRSGAIFTG